MSLKLVRTGPASPALTSLIGTPTAVRLSSNGLRAFHRSQYNSPSGNNKYQGQINAVDWDGSTWTLVSGIGGGSGGNELYEEGNVEFVISKNGTRVAWGFRYLSPNSFQWVGFSISILGGSTQHYYSFSTNDTSSPSYWAGSQVTTSANAGSGNLYSPVKARFSSDGSIIFIWFTSISNLIQIDARRNLFFPSGGIYGGNLQNFEVSGNGNHIFVFIGGSLKLFSWDGSAWQFANDFTTADSACAVNFDGSVVAIKSAGVKVYKNTAGTWAQLGGDLQDGTPWVNESGTLVAAGNRLFEWNGSAWVYKWNTLGAMSDDGTVAVAASGPGSIIRYELKDVAPIYFGGTLASSIYAGATEARAIYYGSSQLWNISG